MRFSVFTASTPEWTPDEAVRHLAAQGWDGVEWRVVDQDDAPVPGFWKGNRATWPLTGLEADLPRIAALTRGAGLEFSGIGGYARSFEHDDVARLLAATAALGAGRVRVTMPLLSTGRYPDLFDATRKDLEWATGLAARHGVTVLVELHHETIVSSASAAMRLLDGFDPRHVGVREEGRSASRHPHAGPTAGLVRPAELVEQVARLLVARLDALHGRDLRRRGADGARREVVGKAQPRRRVTDMAGRAARVEE